MPDSEAEGPTLESFAAGLRALVFGASGALGGAFVELLAAHPRVARIYAAARDPRAVRVGGPGDERVERLEFDLDDEDRIAGAVAAAAADEPLDLVIVATGVLHDGAGLQPEKTWRSLSAPALQRAFAINATGPALIAKHALDALATGRKAVFAALSARVGCIEDNRLGGWHAYRASKAALHMLIRGFAIELARRNPTAVCLALHPGSVDSRLSRPFQSAVPPGRLLSPARSARALLQVIDARTVADSERAWAWDGQTLPF